jgi:hypothetical protein
MDNMGFRPFRMVDQDWRISDAFMYAPNVHSKSFHHQYSDGPTKKWRTRSKRENEIR